MSHHKQGSISNVVGIALEPPSQFGSARRPQSSAWLLRPGGWAPRRVVSWPATDQLVMAQSCPLGTTDCLWLKREHSHTTPPMTRDWPVT